MRKASGSANKPTAPVPRDSSNAPDEALLAEGYRYAKAGDLGNARKNFLWLIQRYPNSPFMPNAYVAFGDFFFDEAAADPSKLDLAHQAYLEAVKYPPATSNVFGYAWYKLASVFVLKGDDAKALNAFRIVLDEGSRSIDQTQAEALARAARAEVIPAFARVGAPGEAFAFFRRLSGDPPGISSRTLHMAEDLGREYFRAGKTAAATTLFTDLSARDRMNGCRYAAYLAGTRAAALDPTRPLSEQLPTVDRALAACGAY